MVTEARIEVITASVMYGFLKYQPDLVVIEGHAYNRSNTGTTAVHELHGVVKQELWKSESPFVICAPISLKAFACHYRASKEEMIEAAIEWWPQLRNISGKKDDLADALHLARYGYENIDNLLEIV